MKTLKLIALIAVCCSLALRVSAQEASNLVLTQDDLGQTFSVHKGTLIEVHLQPFGDLYVSYDAVKLELVAYDPVITLDESYPVESGVITPEIIGEPGSALLPAPASSEFSDTGVTAEVKAEPAVIQPSGEGEVAVGGVAVIEGAIVTNPGVDVEPPTAHWQFSAMDAGATVLEIRSFLPPCRDQICPMMPEFSYSVNLNIKGDALAHEPVSVDAIPQRIGPLENEKTVKTRIGNVIVLDLPDLDSPYRIVYNPLFVQFLPSSRARFQVMASGIQTLLGIERDDGLAFMVNLEVDAECDSCGVRDG